MEWKMWHSDYLNILDNRSVVNVILNEKKKNKIIVKYPYYQSCTEPNRLDENSSYFCIFHSQQLNIGIVLKM